MSAVVSDMIDFVLALERQTPRGLHPCTDAALDEYFTELRDAIGDPAAVYKITGKICWRIVQELEFTAENYETFGDHRTAWRARRQAARFAARFGQPCEPSKLSKKGQRRGRPAKPEPKFATVGNLHLAPWPERWLYDMGFRDDREPPPPDEGLT
ncbi:MAG TPA: hypothetical protein VGZ89_18880 [Xanthobacteraceae bacterium]|jgi:hypothetical protein|nr:hypothetical protein [Xanthobacteraceae bacterium]